MASWFTRAIDRITPWDRGGEVQRRQERKRREDEERRRSQPQPTQSTGLSVGVAQPTQQISVRQPENRFNKSEYDIGIKVTQAQDNRKINLPKPARPLTPEEQRTNAVNRGLDAGKSWEDIARENQLDLNSVREYSKATRPDYGIKVEKPKQSIGNRFRDIFDANTQADQWRRQQGNRLRGDNKPIVLENPGNIGTATRDFGVGAVKGVGRGARALATMPVEGVRMGVSGLTGNTEATALAQHRLMRNIYGQEAADKVARGENLSAGDYFGGVMDMVSVIPAVAGARFATSAIRAGLAQGGRQGLRIGGRGILRGADDAFFGVRDARNLGRGAYRRVRGRTPTPAPAVVPSGIDDLDDAAIAASAEAAIQATRPRPITVASNIPVDIAEGIPQPINVRNLNPDRPLIREVGGDARTSGEAAAQLEQAAQQTRETAFNNNVREARPDRSVEDITLRQPEAPYQLDPKVATNAQDKLIDDYAAWLREMGEGNGVDILPDGRRVSNNVRFGDTKGKRMTKAMWREEAERQLRAGQADPAIQREFTDAADPEVQSMLARGERPDVPEGRPIQVPEERGIDVVDRTDVPTNLPETPGTVRVTTQADPQATRTQAAAEQPPTPIPKDALKALKQEASYYHETDPTNAMKLAQGITSKKGLNVASDEAFALGQGGKGAVVEFAQDGFNTKPIKKPGTDFTGQKEFTVLNDATSPKSVKSITFKDASAESSINSRMLQKLTRIRGFERTVLDDGRIKYVKATQSQPPKSTPTERVQPVPHEVEVPRVNSDSTSPIESLEMPTSGNTDPDLVYDYTVKQQSTRYRKAIARNIGQENKALADEIRAGKKPKEVLKINESKDAVDSRINEMTDDEVISHFSAPRSKPTDYDLFMANGSLRRLEPIAKEVDANGLPTARAERAGEAITNAIDTIEAAPSAAGRTLSASRIAYHDMPNSLKARYFEKRTGVDLQDADRKRLLDVIDSAETDYNKAQQFIDDLKSGKGNSKELRQQIDQLEASYSVKNGIVLDTLKDISRDQMGIKAKAGEALANTGNLGRTFMLSAPSGRTFDMVSTGFTAASRGNEANIAALIGKGWNAITRGNKLESKLLSPKTIASGGARGLRQTWRDVRKGTTRVEDVKFLQNVNRGDLNRPAGLGTRLVHGMTVSPDAATRGFKDAHLERLGNKVGRDAGLSGKELREFTKNYKYFADPKHVQQAQESWRKVNMMHDNEITRALEGAARALSGGVTKDSSVMRRFGAGLIKNAILPFTRYTGGLMHTILTEKNLVARAARMGKAVYRHDGQGFVNQLAGLANDTLEATVLTGAVVPMLGGELVDHDAEGNSYDGVYIRFGDNYFPVNLAGIMAPGIITGYAFQKSMTDNGFDPKNFIIEYGSKLGATAFNNPLVAGNTLLGDASQAAQDISRAKNDNERERAIDRTVPSLIQGGLSPYINPGFLRDASSALDSTSLNPTGEAPNTRATKINPNTGREVVDGKQTAINRWKSGIPFLSQDLDRREGVNARNIVDRSLHRTRSTEIQNQQRADEQAKADQKLSIEQRDKDYESRGVPKTGDGILKAFENDDWDKMIEGNRWALERAADDGEISQKTKDKYERDIRKAETLRDNNLSFADWEEYDSIDVTEWRKLANTDPEAYNRLWQIDQLMAQNNASDARGKPDKQKYSVKESKSKSKSRSGGGGGSRKYSTEFGKITGSGSSPINVRSYASMLEQARSGSTTPLIKRTRPNIVHRIGTRGYN